MHPGERGSIVARMARFKGLVEGLAATCAALAAVGLAGCHTAPQARATPEPQQDPSALTVMAEVALQKGDCRAASDDYALAANHGTAELARRASQVSLACHDLPAAWQAAQRWRALAPNDRSAQLVYGTVALMLYRIPQAHEALAPLVSGTGRQGEREALSLIQLLSDDPEVGASPTLAALGQSVDARSTPPLVIGAFGALALEAYDFHVAELRAQELLQRDADSGGARRLLAVCGCWREMRREPSPPRGMRCASILPGARSSWRTCSRVSTAWRKRGRSSIGCERRTHRRERSTGGLRSSPSRAATWPMRGGASAVSSIAARRASPRSSISGISRRAPATWTAR